MALDLNYRYKRTFNSDTTELIKVHLIVARSVDM